MCQASTCGTVIESRPRARLQVLQNCQREIATEEIQAKKEL